MTGRVLRSWGTCGMVLAFAVGLHAQTRQIILTERRNLGRVTYPATATVTSNMIDGYVRVTGNGRFIFPVCDNSIYRPFAASAGGTTGAYFAVSAASAVTSSHKGGNYPPLPIGGPFPLTSKDANIGKVSASEYWDVNGSTATRLTFSWNTESAMSSFLPGGDFTKLYIVAWNGTRWVKIPGTVDAVSIWGGASTLGAGSFTTTNAIIPNTYLAYTFGSDLSSAREITQPAMAAVMSDSTVEVSKLNAEEITTTVYPNPARDLFFVQAAVPERIRHITIHDHAGQKVLVKKRPGSDAVDVSKLAAGMYVVNIEDESGRVTTRKIIINK